MPLYEQIQASDVLVIRPFQPGDETSFQLLNEQWIERDFEIEAKDRSMLHDPQKTIIQRGGHILFATMHSQCVGCCALLRMSEDEFEVAKMAVAPEFQGKGIGRALLSAALKRAHAVGIRRLYLETNHILKPAIALYESLGFRHINPADVTPSPYARADVYMEMFLTT